MKNDVPDGSAGMDGYLFRLIATFEAAAMQQLGKIAHPVTGGVEVDLAGARDSIEMLVAIQRKTTGNLNEDEKRLLDHVLYQLRMNYVDVAAAQKGESEAPGPKQEGPSAEGASEKPGGGQERESGAEKPEASDDEGIEPPGDGGES